MSNSIRELPQDVIDKLKSSVVITSLNGVASGLLKNSLDAGAAKVNITVDYTRGNCTVEDNGSGIQPGEFREAGGLGKLHHTSRFPPSDGVYGRHGDFLASLATLSLLSVSSHHHRHASHNSVLFHNSKVLARHLPALPEQRLKSFDRGTRVIVRDLFGSMPVRVKQRASLSSERVNLDKEWSHLVVHTVAILLSWHSTTTVSLRERTSQRELRLKPPESLSLVSRASRLLIQASLVDSAHADSWVPISASAGQVSVKGCISTKPVATRRSQFISIGMQPLTNEYGTNVIYEDVNKVFANSDFGLPQGRPAKVGLDKPRTDDVTDKALKSRKGVERWPVFYFRIRLSESAPISDAEDLLDNSKNDLTAVLDLLKAVCYGFLKKQLLRPRKGCMSTDDSVFSTSRTLGRSKSASRKRPPSLISDHMRRSSPHPVAESSAGSDSPFDGWQRIKVGHARGPTHAKIGSPGTPSTGVESTDEDRLIGEGGRLLRKPFSDLKGADTEEGDTNSRHFRNGRPISIVPEGAAEMDTRAIDESSSEPQRVRPDKDTGPQKGQPSEWLQGVLGSWNNTVFESAPPNIPRAYDPSAYVHDSDGTGRVRPFSAAGFGSQVMFGAGFVSLNGRISKTALSEAEIICQVDRKFILAKLPLDDMKGSSRENKSSALVMLDQHAVDERCQLEGLMASYFVHEGVDGVLKPDVELLEGPLKYEVGAGEGNLLRRYQDHFAMWGIIYQADQRGGKSPREASWQVKVAGLPVSISERCETEPRLLVDLLREEVWMLAEGGRPLSTPFVQNDREHSWVSNFHGCPQGILELLHSRSCRSAVMFNDDLSREQCENMLRRLSQCAFPFQCAHGRPSMAPLVDLGKGSRTGAWDGDERVVDWKGWSKRDDNED